MQQDPHMPNPNGHGWTRLESGELDIQWTTLRPVPEHVLKLLSCNCSKHCKENRCPCILNKLHCTDACHSFDCDNQLEDESDIDEGSEEDFSDDDE